MGQKNEVEAVSFLAPLRGIFFLILIVPVTVIWASAGIVGTLVYRGVKWPMMIMRSWCHIILWTTGVQVTHQGQDNLPQEGSIFIFNHTSYFDIPAFMAPMKKPAFFGAKSELFKIPFFGWCMSAFKILPIHRGDRDRVLELYKKSIERIKNGHYFVLAGEGGRHKFKNEVGDRFKGGPFIFAITAQCPIIPVVITGARDIHSRQDILPNRRKWKSQIHCRFLPAVSTKGLTLEDRGALTEKVRQLMAEASTEGQGQN